MYQEANRQSRGGRGGPPGPGHSVGEITPTSVMRAHLLPPLWAFSGRSPIVEEHLVPEDFQIAALPA